MSTLCSDFFYGTLVADVCRTIEVDGDDEIHWVSGLGTVRRGVRGFERGEQHRSIVQSRAWKQSVVQNVEEGVGYIAWCARGVGLRVENIRTSGVITGTTVNT